jgi:hypothetical protein
MVVALFVPFGTAAGGMQIVIIEQPVQSAQRFTQFGMGIYRNSNPHLWCVLIG